MNYGSDPADQIVRFSLDGTEMVLKLSGLAAKNFALFVYAVLNDQQKVRGKTKLVRMLKERRPFKFFRIPENKMREFAREAKDHGLLYTAIRNKSRQGQIELVVFADDASKVNRILDNLNLDFVQAQAGDATVEQVPAAPSAEQPSAAPEKKPEPAVEVETVATEHGAVEFQVGDGEEAFNLNSMLLHGWPGRKIINPAHWPVTAGSWRSCSRSLAGSLFSKCGPSTWRICAQNFGSG